MGDLLSDDYLRAIMNSAVIDEHGGDWRRHLDRGDPDYDPDAEFDANADRLKDRMRRSTAGLFANGAESRLWHEWANYCRECVYFEDLDFPKFDEPPRAPVELEIPYCSKLNAQIPYEEADRKEKRHDCPLGTDENAYYERRKKEIAEEEREQRFERFKEHLDEAWPEFKDRVVALIRAKSAESVQ